MADDGFWQRISAAREAAQNPADIEDVAEALVALLVQAGADEIRRFDYELDTATAQAYGWPLWGAAYIMNGGCSDDGFDYFLGWLVGQGREVFERALADPDSLAEVVEPENRRFASESVIAAPWNAYKQATGAELTDGPLVDQPELGPGWDFDDEAEMRRRYPRLVALFP